MHKTTYSTRNYNDIFKLKNVPDELDLADHLTGFDPYGRNPLLDHLHNNSNLVTIYHDQIPSELVKKNYPKINFKLKVYRPIWDSMVDYNIHPELDYKNFVCSFNGSPHVSRKLLVSILYKFKWFDERYCSKNFSFSEDTINGHVRDYVENPMYQTFFCCPNKFFQSISSFGHVRYNHSQNIYNLEHRLTESFLHIVSETLATSYVPFVTEKFLYSVVTRGLFLAYAQPGWHTHLEKYYGFKKYDKIFDYRFDTIENPVERLIELMCMLSKFSILSTDEWRDLYLLEQDTIEFNYNHYFSGEYLNSLNPYIEK